MAIPSTIYDPYTSSNAQHSALGSMGINTALGVMQSNPRVQLGGYTLTADTARLAGMNAIHPALEPMLLTLLLNMAQSADVNERRNAIMHKHLPLSMAVMMCGDKDEEVRRLAETVVAYAQKQEKNDDHSSGTNTL